MNVLSIGLAAHLKKIGGLLVTKNAAFRIHAVCIHPMQAGNNKEVNDLQCNFSLLCGSCG
jgi:hypothetical protein